MPLAEVAAGAPEAGMAAVELEAADALHNGPDMQVNVMVTLRVARAQLRQVQVKADVHVSQRAAGSAGDLVHICAAACSSVMAASSASTTARISLRLSALPSSSLEKRVHVDLSTSATSTSCSMISPSPRSSVLYELKGHAQQAGRECVEHYEILSPVRRLVLGALAAVVRTLVANGATASASSAAAAPSAPALSAVASAEYKLRNRHAGNAMRPNTAA
eukprot:6191104-Pleurochrysis_carterae.AAC.1